MDVNTVNICYVPALQGPVLGNGNNRGDLNRHINKY